MKKVLIILLVAVFLFPIKSFGLKNLPGKYELIGDIKKAFGKDRVTIVEFFNFSCRHCYNFLPHSKNLERKYGNKIIYVKIPIFWGRQTEFPAIAFYLAQSKGISDEITKNIFDANFKGGAQIFDPRVVNFIISESGISEDVRNQKNLTTKVKQGMALASRYKANETPTIILNDVIKITPRIAGGNVEKMSKNMDLIISELLPNK
tara:strand:+ start:1990 stop:2604 length:615 start_codon:yes stop_codon:yes gene_type:complete